MGVAPGQCFTCHNDRDAKGKPGRHLQTMLGCDSCHRTTAWIPANFSHTGVAPGSCVTCHTGMNAKGKSSNHFVTTRSCDSCHRSTAWTPATNYNHVAPAFVRHNRDVECTDCHTTKGETVVFKAATYKGTCAGCHAPVFKPDAHIKVESPRIPYTVLELKDCTTSCHIYATNASGSPVKKSIPSRHRATDGGF